MTVDRTAREAETRQAQARPQTWRPPNLLPDPNPQPGFTFRWVRTATLGEADATNVSSKLREGWEPVKAEDHPELMLMADKDSRFKGGVEIGGLLLCKIPTEMAMQRAAYYEGMARQQMDAVDNNFMRENDPRMPLFRERQSKVTFGRGR